jgi:hypothetical protein
MSPLIAPILGIIDNVLDRVLPLDAEKKAQLQLELIKLDQAGRFKELEFELTQMTGQLEINKEEAKHSSVFVSGWRPAVGWTCVGGLSYQLLFRPILGWAASNLFGWAMPPSLELDSLMTLLFGMLGLGAYRTVEKIKGKA